MIGPGPILGKRSKFFGGLNVKILANFKTIRCTTDMLSLITAPHGSDQNIRRVDAWTSTHPVLLRCWWWWHTSCPQRFVSQGNLCQTAVPVSVSTLTVVLCTNTTYMPNILLRWTFNTFNVYLYVWYFGLVCCTVVVRISKFELLYLWLQCCRIEEMYGCRICGIHNSLFATSGTFFLETALVLLPSQAIFGCWSGKVGLKIFRRLL